ncbi:four-jointed box protein 1 [Synchiropus splendidus]|uniref:four-jointed box protein 1 n=1 Tax=Synchiropus splendidus TaxID=270530 RepID=UPI00237EDC64|nr:four-jointed box protein 1 [Synchiropus splendidus]
MRAVFANFFALLLLCAFGSVVYIWSALEERLERHKRASFYPSLPVDLSVKTFRALLAVQAAQRLRNVSGVPAGSVDGNNAGDKRSPQPVKLGSPVEDGVFWSEWLEGLIPVGFSEDYARAWRGEARTQRIVQLEPGCGRISNQLATFADGTKACVRYGINADQVQGETLTYYLAALLGITNLPPLVLSQLDRYGEQWAAVRTRIDGLQWSDRAVVSLTAWVPNLTGVVTPASLRPDSGGLRPVREDFRNKSTAELVELVQWSDLILFDYLSANFDRLVSNLFSLQWDPRVMERDTSNLLRTPRGDLVFIDNEAGLVHGFRVLDMWEKYHHTVLSSVCVFRRRTVERLRGLRMRGDARMRLLESYRDSEPLSAHLGFLSDEHAALLQDRIERLYQHILHCKSRYRPS